jgi:flagellar biosynthetic protein FlhB
MAENDAQERTEQATPKRLEEARRKGQIPRSRDLSTAAVTLVGGAALYLLGGTITGQMAEMMRRGLALSRDEATDSTFMLPALSHAAADGLWLSMPVLGAITLAAIIAPLALGGWSFAAQAMMPQFSRLDPIAAWGACSRCAVSSSSPRPSRSSASSRLSQRSCCGRTRRP